MAILATVLMAPHIKKGHRRPKPKDFMPVFDRGELDADTLESKIDAVFAGMAHVDEREALDTTLEE